MPSLHRLFAALLATAAIAATTTFPVGAQPQYPERPVRMIVTWPAGSPLDVGVRAVGQGITEGLRQPVVVDNRPGANGIIGTEAGVRSAPDGYTVVSANVETLAINPHVYPQLKYDPLKDLEPVAMLGKLPLVLMVRSGLGANDGRALIQLARSKPGALTYGSWGIGSVGHLGIAMMEEAARIDMLHVPYQGSALAFTALSAGQIDMMLFSVPVAMQQQQSGKLRMVGVTSAVRSPAYPAVPTLAEQGFQGVNAEQWIGFFVPRGTPPEAKELLGREIARYVASPQGHKALVDIGIDPVTATPAEMVQLVRSDHARWGRLIKDKGVQVR